MEAPGVSHAVDIYSFGIVLWELITGENPQKCNGCLRTPRYDTSLHWVLVAVSHFWTLMLSDRCRFCFNVGLFMRCFLIFINAIIGYRSDVHNT